MMVLDMGTNIERNLVNRKLTYPSMFHFVQLTMPFDSCDHRSIAGSVMNVAFWCLNSIGPTSR